MKKVALSAAEKEILLDCIQEHRPKLEAQFYLLDSYMVDRDTINDMRGAIGDELVCHGFNSESKIHEYGLELEALIDTLANLYL